jgi:hypothetical protein
MESTHRSDLFFSRGSYKLTKAKPQGPFKCQICGKEFVTSSGLWKHLKKRSEKIGDMHVLTNTKSPNFASFAGQLSEILSNLQGALNLLNKEKLEGPSKLALVSLGASIKQLKFQWSVPNATNESTKVMKRPTKSCAN